MIKLMKIKLNIIKTGHILQINHPYRILIIGGPGSGKTNALINLLNEQKDIDKIYLYAKDLSEPKYEYFIKKREDVVIKHVNNPNEFIKCSNTMDGVYENIDDYNSSKNRKVLIVFDDIIADIMTNKEFQAIIKELFIPYYSELFIKELWKTRYFTCFYHTILFFCSKGCKTTFNTLFD